MDQVLAIKQIQDKINKALEQEKANPAGDSSALLQEIASDLDVFLAKGIDFKIIVDSLDDSVLITDHEGLVLYVNPAYASNTGISYDEVVGRTIQDIQSEGTLFKGGSAMDVLKHKKRAFRLATTFKGDKPQVGFTVGVPIFDENGELHQVVVSSRPIHTLRGLKKDFQSFLDEANAIKENKDNIKLYESADDPILSDSLIGSSASLQNVWDMIQKVAPTDASVMISGESGVGKEIVADEIYKMGPRKDKPFVKVNCASIPVNLLESELFGYEKGAFTGASASGKKGLFEMANHGTLLLDEIGDMPLDLQVKLLRAIQNKEITRVGGTKPIPLDIRFISSTNSDLKKKIAEGTFRRDLFYRLSVIPIHIPPLRERTDDIEELCNHFIDIYGEHHGRRIHLLPEQLNLMKKYNWPGNIRELENVIEYLTICTSGTSNVNTLMLQNLLNIDDNMDMGMEMGIEMNMEYNEVPLAESMEQYEKARIENALANAHNLREAGKILGVNASTVSRKIKQYGIDYSKSK
ncbi:MAG: sigma 54-interacting transcriptional regulator [Clostridia bacterium]|nr:sigma 54-interacting transcriptional regulator [Clostridia bacterium]